MVRSNEYVLSIRSDNNIKIVTTNLMRKPFSCSWIPSIGFVAKHGGKWIYSLVDTSTKGPAFVEGSTEVFGILMYALVPGIEYDEWSKSLSERRLSTGRSNNRW